MSTPHKSERPFWQTSLVARLVGTFFLLSSATVALLGFVAYVQARAALERSVLDRLEVAATLKADTIRRWIDDQERDFLLIPGVPSLYGDLMKLVDLPPEDPRSQTARHDLREVLGALTSRRSEWKEIQVLSRLGVVLASSEPAHEGELKVLDRFFLRGQEETYVEKVYPSPSTYTPAMTISTPFGGGDKPGVLAIHLDLGWLDRLMRERSGLGEGAQSYLVDRVNVPLSGDLARSGEHRRGIHSRGIDEAVAGRDGADTYLDFRGVPVLGVYRFLPDLDVALLVEIPRREAFAPARRLLAVIVGVGALAAALLAAGTFLLARQIAHPVLAVADAAVRVEEGDLKARAPAVTHDEVGTLARAFNRMTERLAGLIEELEVRNDELTRFTYTVSHDLKTPLVTIRGFLGLLEKDLAAGDEERVTVDMERIRDATGTMSQLLQELLELSRIGRLMNPPEDVPVGELVREALAVVEGRLDGVEVRVGDEMGVVHGDRVRLREVFQNLIENAARFMGEQEAPRIEIGTDVRPDEVVFWVKDNGVGIEPQYHELVFGLFERLDATTEGTGIGLALVQRIVEYHGGRVWVESEGRGHGATFFVSLPASQA